MEHKERIKIKIDIYNSSDSQLKVINFFETFRYVMIEQLFFDGDKGSVKKYGDSVSNDNHAFNSLRFQEFCEVLAKENGIKFDINNPTLSCLVEYEDERYKVDAFYPCTSTNGKLIFYARHKRSNSGKSLGGFGAIPDDQAKIKERKNILIASTEEIEGLSFLDLSRKDPMVNAEELKDVLIATIGASPLRLNLSEFNRKAEFLVNESFTYGDALVSIPKMDPSYIIVDELKPENIFSFLQKSLQYRGLVSTIKANSMNSILDSIRFNLIEANKRLNKEDLRDLVRGAVDLFVHIDDNGETTIRETSELLK